MEDQENESIALHVLVIGFHHKKGMQVEYVYPPFDSENGELPDKWKHLPSLCLPDGAHNHEADTIYFHLPHLTKDNQTVFGVSCYRQIDAEKVTNKTSDITRNTVQKSVCVLTTLPIYGYVQERLKVTTKVYFKGADFSDVRDLEGLHHDLNNTNWKDRLMHGLCVSEAVKIFGRNVLVLFKLLLLERKVLFYHSPVAPLARIITSLLALLPANLPDGLAQAAATRNECEVVEEAEEVNQNDNLDISYSNPKPRKSIQISPSETLGEVKEELNKIINSVSKNADSSDCLLEGVPIGDLISISGKNSESDDELSERRSSNSSLTSVTSRAATTTPNPSPSEPGDDVPISPSSGMPLPFPLENPNDISQLVANTEKYALLEPSDTGLPLQIYTKGNLLHPYLSLQYLEVLTSPSTRAFIVDVSRENEVFNSSFISAWKETHNYRMWLAGGPYPSLLELTPGHPHAGHLSMNDMRIRLSHTIQSLDKGRRLNQTLASTGTAVVKTKEAVGGAITSAKGALSTLWTSFTAPAATSKEDGEDEPEEGIEALEAEHPERNVKSRVRKW
ncbi:Late secretory pathway protein AVL9-like protein [Armadillidium nasatum]|uniref:Late secretory pathway protein AVL9-like protein n=1 Tax=Armadillidium nasatum TaxID=96803 RepID=A0A5N5TE44_9CRUS|nr:Late secretory pathway protein AVL9-like protein [Armadillidium nasatum]